MIIVGHALIVIMREGKVIGIVVYQLNYMKMNVLFYRKKSLKIEIEDCCQISD